MITDINNPSAGAKAQSQIPLMLDVVTSGEDGDPGVASTIRYNHIPGGSNVLYLDGHAEFMGYEAHGAYPVTGVFAYLTGSPWAPGQGLEFSVN